MHATTRRNLRGLCRSWLVLAAVISAAFGQVSLISGYNFGQFIGAGYPSLSGVTGDPVGSIGSNYRLNVQAPLTSDGGFVGNNSLEGNYSNGFGRIYWDGTNGSSNYNFSNGVQIVATDVGTGNGVNSITAQGYQMGLLGDGLNLALTTAVANNKLAFVQNTTGYMDYDPSAFPKSELLTSNANLTFAARVDSPVTVGWFLGSSTTAFATTSLSGSDFTSYSVNLPPEFYNLLSSVLIAQFSGTATIDNIQFNGVALGSTPPATSQFWKGGTGAWTAALTPTDWRDDAGAVQSEWKSGTAVFRAVTGQTPGTVTVDPAGVIVTGLQFTTTGYTIAGGNINTTTASTPIQVDTGATATVSAIIAGTGGINKTSAGTLVLGGANTYAGTTSVTAGTLAVNGVQTGTGAVSVASGATLTGSGTLAGAVSVAGGGILSQVSASKLTVPSLVLADTSIINVTLGAPATAELFKVGGALTLGGTLNITAGTAFGAGLYRIFDFTGALTGTLAAGTVPSGFTATIQTSVANQVNAIIAAEAVTNLPMWAGGAGTWSASTTAPLTAWKSADGATTGGWTTGGAIFGGTAGTVTVDNAAGAITFTSLQLATTGYTLTGGTLTTTTAATALRVGDATPAGSAITGTVSSKITGTGGINKTDLGTLTLSGANDYAGTTTVSAGTLRVNGVQTGTGAVSVASGATLTGSGTLAGAVTVAGGGILSQVAGTTLTVPSLVLADTSIFNFTLGAVSTTPLIQVGGNLTLDGILNVSSSTGFGAGLYRLINFTGTLTDSIVNIGTMPTGFTATIDKSVANQINLNVTAGTTPPTPDPTPTPTPTGPLTAWTGGTGTWTAAATSISWKTADGTQSGPWTPGPASFAGTAGTVTVDNAGGAVVFTGLDFRTTGYTVASGTLTTNTPSSAVKVGDGTSAGATSVATISSVIAGTGGLEKTDLGRLVLSGANTYTGGTTISAGTLQIGNAGTTGSVAGNITNNAALAFNRTDSLTFAGTISGSGSVTQAGTGTTILTANNTYAGGTTISAGTLQLGSGLTAGSITGNVVNNGTLAINRSDAMTLAGVISGTGALTKTGAGTATLTGANTYTGGTTITTGTLQIGAGGTSGAIAGNVTNNATLAVNRSDAVTLGGVISGTGALQQNGRGTTTLTGANTYTGTTTVGGGTLLIDGNQSTANGAITVAAGGALGGNGTTGGNITVAAGGALTGTAGRTLTTTGSITLADTSRLNFSLGAPSSKSLFVSGGALTLDGVLNVANAGGLAVGTYRLADYGGTLTNNTVTIGNAAINPADLSIVITPSNPVNLVVAATVSDYWKGGAGTWTASGADTSWQNLSGAAAGAWQSRTATFAGTAGAVAVDNAGGAVNLTGAQFVTTGYSVTGGTLTTAAGGTTLQVGNASAAGSAHTATISSVIAGTGAVTKTDLGTLTLSGTNTYSGATTVAEGTLLVTGNSVGATGAVTVASGATLGGTGTLGGAVSVASGATLNGTGTIGGAVTVAGGGILSQTAGSTLTMGNLTLANTSLVNVTLGAPSTTGLFQVNGNLTLDGTLNVTGAPAFGAGSYRIFGYTGVLTNNTLDVGSLPSTAYQGTVQTSIANQVNLIVGITPGSLVNWSGGSGTWSTGGTGFGSADGVITNGGWTPGQAIFGGTAGTVVVDTAAPVVVTGLQLASNGYTLTGGAITTNTADTALRVGDGTSAGAGFTGTVSSAIIGAGGINKTDLGTLVLGGANTFAGTTTVTAGTLVVTGSNATTAGTTVTGGTLQIGNGGTTGSIAGDITNNAALRINRSNATSLDGVISGTGTVTKDGTGTTTLGGNNTYAGATNVNTGTLVLTGTNTGTGGTTVASAGVLQVGAGGETGSIAGAITNNGALRLNRTGELAVAGAISGTGTVSQLGTGTTTLAGNNTYSGATNITAGTLAVTGTNNGTGAITVAPTATLQIGTGGTTGSVAAAITNNGTVAVNRSNAATLANAIGGTGNLIKQGAGATTLTGANTYAGTTTVSAGTLILGGSNTGGGTTTVANAATLQVGAGATAGSLAGNVSNNGTVVFNRTDALTFDGVISGSGAVTKQGTGTTTLSGNNTFSGATTVSAGTLIVSGTNTSSAGTTVAASSTLQVGAGGTTGTIAGNVANSGTVAFNRSDAANFGGVISGTGAVTQLGAGTTTLTGANTYSGATTVTNGTLVLTGANTGTGATTIATAGTLQLGAGGTSGSTAGAITNNGTLAINRSDAVTLGGVISGTGGLRQQGSGTTTLTGANTFTGGTTVSSGTLVLTGANTGTGATTIATAATLQIGSGGTTGSTAGAITNNGTLAINRSDAVTLANAVSGTGALVQAGAGTTTLTGANLHTGGTTISAGTLALGTGGSLAGNVVNNAAFQINTGGSFAGNVVNNGALTINRTDASSLGGTISGTGTLAKLGTGTAALTGANTYTGGTTITAGAIEITNDANLGAATSGVTLNGGTLRSAGAVTSARAITVGAGNGTIDTGANIFIASGAVSGAGTLEKLGTGELRLSGANTLTGLTTITAGSIRLDGGSLAAATIAANGSLGGNGTVRGNLTNSGKLNPGASPGTVTVVGNFTQTATGTYNAELASATSFDSLSVSGNVTLAGTLAVTGLNGYVPDAGDTFKIIDATGTASTVTGTFTTLTSPWEKLSPMLKFEALYSAKDVKLSMTQLPFAELKDTAGKALETTPNLKAVGGGIDGAIKLGSVKELQKALNALPDTKKVQAAIKEISPQRYERWFEQAVYSTGANIRVVENRMDQLQREPKAGLWTEVVHRDSRFDATTEKTKARAASDGIMVGGDARVLPDLQVGAVFGYTSEKLDLDENGSATDAKRFTGAIYGRYDLSPWFAEAVAGGSHAALEGKRTVAIPGYAQTADIETKSRDFYGSVRGGYTFQLGRAKLTPYAGGQYVSWKADAATETGAKQAGVKLQDQSRDSLASRAGITVAFPFAGEEVSFTPRLDVAWRHEFRTARQTLIGEIGGSPFTLPGGSFASSGAGGILGLNAVADKEKRDGVVASLGFDVTFGSRFTAYLRVVAESDTATSQAIEVRAGSELRF